MTSTAIKLHKRHFKISEEIKIVPHLMEKLNVQRASSQRPRVHPHEGDVEEGIFLLSSEGFTIT